VSGAAGFIGSHLCDALLARGWEVVAADNLITGSAGNVEHLRADPRFELLEADVAASPPDPPGPIDAVFHFASPASPKDFERLAVEILDAGTRGTRNLLDLAASRGARFLLASTSEVYGDPLVHPQPESYWGNVNPIGPRGCYDEAKRCAEAYTMAYRRFRGVDTQIVRIFNTHGPRMRLDDGRVIPNFLGQALRGQPLTIYGDGSQTRSLCHVSDLVAGVLAVFDGGDGAPYNLGNPNEVTVRELAETVLRLTGAGSALVDGPLPEDDPKQRCPDIARARALGWEPRVDLEPGLRETLEYFRSMT
jgi:dTDP-glucose 4,6-dehydratase